MAVDSTPREGDIVEFADKGKIQLGVVMATDEKSSKLKILNASARELALPLKQVMHVLKAKVATSLPLSNITNEIKSLDLRADNFIDQCRIDDLWMLVAGEEDEVSLETLVSLMFQEPSAMETLAMIRALRNDKIYFKTISPSLFSPRPQNIVDDLIRQAEQKAKKIEWRNRFAEEAASMLKLSEQEREDAREEGRFPSKDTDEAWKLVQDYAILGMDAQDKTEAEALIECLQSRINRGFSGTAHMRARSLLRETGYWAPDTNVALLKYEISTAFPPNVENEAFQIYQKPVCPPNRVDLSHLCVFSIDDPETLDIDDALSIETLENGNRRLGIHIAAPAASIEFNGLIENEARHRATSIYLAEQRIPMIPAILSENALSLMPGMKKNAVTFFITFDSDFNIVERDIVPSIVCSSHRLSYDSVEHLIEEGNDELSDQLRTIQEIAEYSAANRRSHGAIEIDIPEFKLFWNSAENLYELHEIDGSMMSRMLVAECMILANALAAEYCTEHNIPALYRLQPAPTNMPTQETLDAMPNDLTRAYAMRRCMMPAASSMTPAPHAGLGLEQYMQATSPLRRYADLICHYQLESWFANQKPRFDADEFNAILSETDLGLSHAKSASHEANMVATLQYLKQLGNQPLQAIILQYVTDRGDIAQVSLIQTQVRANVATKTRLPIGTICSVRIDNVKPEEGVILLQFIEVVS